MFLEESDYDLTLQVQYKNNCEYRKMIRNVFKMDMGILEQKMNDTYESEDLDEETKDELLCDLEKMYIVLDKWMEITRDNPFFLKLYELASEKMFSTDIFIGQSILFSYDYFWLFHPCLCFFYENKNEFNENNKYYIQLKEKLEKKR